MKRKPRLFFDTSVLFAGIWSAEGGARLLLKLGEAEAVQLLVSSQVLQEIEDVIRRKAPQYLPTLAVLLDRARFIVVPSAPGEVYGRCQSLVPHAGDAHILSDAWHNEADYLVTLDRAHFLDVLNMTSQLPFLVGTPGDCLAWYKKKMQNE